VPGATVTLTSEGTGVAFTTKTTASGTYVFEAIQIGTYAVEVEATGFRKFISHDNVVTIGRPTTVNVKLEVGQLTQQVEVTGTAELVQTNTSGDFGFALTEAMLRDL
jgi:hypothetical protein